MCVTLGKGLFLYWILVSFVVGSAAANPLCDYDVYVSPSLTEITEALDQGYDPNELCIPDQGEWAHGRATPLFAAAFNQFKAQFQGRDPANHLTVLKTLLKHGADPNITDTRGDTLLAWMVLAGGSIEAINMLLQNGANPNANFGAALRFAVSGSVGVYAIPAETRFDRKHQLSVEFTSILLSNGANPNLADANGRTAVHKFAAGFAGGQTLDLLLDYGADINAADLQGRTPLHVAASEGRPQQVIALLDAGAIVDQRDNDGALPVDLTSENIFLKGQPILRRLKVQD